MPRETYLVTLDRPNNMTRREMRANIRHAILCRFESIQPCRPIYEVGRELACTVRRDTSKDEGV